MSEKFTPGPWSVEHSEASGIYWVESETSGSVGVCDLFSMDGSVSWCKENAKANAHLIAAAPDLYEALEDLRSNVAAGVARSNSDAVRKANLALEKARGEAVAS